jgi:hypothetical protein
VTGGALRLLAIASVGGALSFLVIRGCASSRPELPTRAVSASLVARSVAFTLHGGPEARITLRTIDGQLERDLPLLVVVDGTVHPVSLDKALFRYEADSISAQARIDTGGSDLVVPLILRVLHDADALVVALTLEKPADRSVALRFDLATDGQAAFVSGVGSLADLGSVSGRPVTLETERGVMGLTSTRGPIDVSTSDGEEHEPGSPMRLAVTSTPAGPSAPADLRLVVAPSTQRVWGVLYGISGESVSRVKGSVKGAGGPARVYGLDADGAPRVALDANPDGTFLVDVPTSVTQWYAALDVLRSSSPVRYTPGTSWPLVLDVSPGGELSVKIVDADTSAPITARLLVHGIDGTLDPSFGPDYRASGAGPLMDSLRGEVVTPLPAGRYRVAATKGIEWSIDATNVNIEPGRQTAIELAPRHVVPTPGIVSADLHVHARPSFDTPVSPEDRVLSLAAAGIDFAVPTEHNIVGDYAPMIAALDLGREIASVPGVEVTTFTPRFGHFGVFPYKGFVPPYKGTNPTALFQAARRGDPTRILQVNHPRLPSAIGYFNVFHYEPQQGKEPPPGMRMDFDTLEVFNGYDLAKADRVASVMRDWFALLNLGYRFVATGDSDSHRIQYQWAGYPRTLIAAGEAASGEKGPLDPAAIVAALKKGHAIVTNGPVLSLDVAGGHAGDEVITKEDPVHVHVVVRAAPWVDVTSLEIVVGGQTVQTLPVPSRPTKIGSEPGTLEEASARTVRLDKELAVPLGAANAWVVAVAHGTRKLDDVLPFMPTVPLAFTNPVWVTRDPKLNPRRPPKPTLAHPAR